MSVQVTRLPSGLTVATEEMPHIETAAVQVWVHAGSRSEQPAEHGIAHVLEHMAFKGTRRRTATEIKEQIADVGGFIGGLILVHVFMAGRTRRQAERWSGWRSPSRRRSRDWDGPPYYR